MLEDQIQSKRVRWIVCFSCAVVKFPIYGIYTRDSITIIMLIVKNKSLLSLKVTKPAFLGVYRTPSRFFRPSEYAYVFPFVHIDPTETMHWQEADLDRILKALISFQWSRHLTPWQLSWLLCWSWCGNASWSPKLHPPGEYNHCGWRSHSGHLFFSTSDYCSMSHMCMSSLVFLGDIYRKIADIETLGSWNRPKLSC